MRNGALVCAAVGGGLGAPALDTAPSGVAHSPQNLNEGGFSNPHFGHRLLSGAAQLPQNLVPGGFSVPQLEHFIGYVM
jgi:hypothetical protein